MTGPSQDEFDDLLLEIVREETPENLAKVPGLYDALAEHFRSDVLERWRNAREDAAIDRERYS